MHDPASLSAMERYLQLKAELQAVLDRMHYNLAPTTDLDGLAALVRGLERVALHGDQVELKTAQAAAAEARRAEQRAREAAAAAAPSVAVRLDAHGIGVSRQSPDLAGPMQAPVLGAAIGVVPEDLAAAAIAFERAGPVMPTAGVVSEAALEASLRAPVSAPVAAAPTTPLSPPAAPLPALVVKQKPPVAKPGRGRGFRLKAKPDAG